VTRASRIGAALALLIALRTGAAAGADPAELDRGPTSSGRLTAADFRGGKLRGMTLAETDRYGSSIYTPGDLAALEMLAVNLTRVLVPVRRCPGCDHFEFPTAQAKYVEELLEAAERGGFRLIVALEPEPAGDKAEYWHDERLKASIRDVWVRLATRFQSSAAIAGYDLINEPVPANARTPAEANRVWVPFAATLIRAIRSVDPDRAIVFEPAPWGFPAGFRALEPLPFPNIVYSFHFYHPHELTHQGIGRYPPGPSYPSRDWHRARLSSELAPVRAFAARHRAPIYVGEFSCIRWAPGPSAARYVQDLVELFATEGWSWTYHTWRGYHGWDAEIPGDAPRALTPVGAGTYRRADAPVISVLARALRRQAEDAVRPAPAGAAGAAR
jgi:endoglucanase